MHKLLGLLVLGLTLTIGFGSVGGCKKGEPEKKALTDDEKKAAAKKAEEEAAAAKKKAEEAAAAKKKKTGDEEPVVKKGLTLTPPKDVEIKQGEKAEVTVTIERKKFDDPVEISFDFPKGSKVTAKGGTIKKGETELKTEVMVAKDAKDEAVEGTVMAKGGDMEKKGMFKVTVKK